KESSEKIAQEQIEAKIKACQIKARKSPKSAEAHYNLARAYLETFSGGTENAVTEFKLAIALKPNYPEAFLGLGEAYDEIALFDQSKEVLTENARKAYQQAIHLRPDYAEAYLKLGQNYLQMDAGAFGAKQAVDALLIASRLSPDNKEV